ncbi:protein arginine N-methyltransferase 1.1 [Drosophila mojavensis]|uniref:Protein arginine N-methyltransferase domain-containing protein n=1 Tax=Drosophila mojavensis TaxID=7230 RepID=B4K9B0_DROMO|nr:protein arginine N-methyltransferase 1.1 [Drosophila mojavensis]EDW15542.1 uncharacterized protein Dmoj_GI22731 [Drosophila mojavensis]
MEDSWNIQEAMLSDVLVSNVYNQFFQQNQMLFKDKIVLDVGCRSGLLSILAVEAGAVKVFAIGNMQSAKRISKVLENGEKAEVFEPLTGCITQVVLPCGLRKVDIIVSEWMGHALFADSLFCQVLYARDKWLVKNGLIFPSVANLYIQGISLDRELAVEKNVLLWDDYVNQKSLMTEKCLVISVDLSSIQDDIECQRAEIKMKSKQSGKMSGCVLYFDISARNAKGQLQKLFSIAPNAPRTYMMQTVLFLKDDPLVIKEQQLLFGRLDVILGYFAPRGVEFSLGIWAVK